MKLCSFCDNRFESKVTYQIYCSTECRTLATKEKIIARHQITKRQKRIGKVRKCLGGCNTELSIYNDDGFCSSCETSKKAVNKMLSQIKGFFEYEQE